MIDDPFRKILPNFVGPLLKLYKSLGLTPNQITFLGCGLGVAAAVAVSLNKLLMALVLWWLGRLFDGTDGIYARSICGSTKFGSYLDINCDMLAYGAIIVAFFHINPEFAPFWIIILFLYVLCISGALALGSLQDESSFQDNRKLHLAAGLAEGGETGIFYSLCFLFPSQLGLLTKIWICILSVTVIARLLLARRVLEDGHK